MKNLRFYEDPGHGWLKADPEDLRRLGILRDISRFSYFDRNDGSIYLEEDCDAGIYLRALDAAGEEYKIRHFHRNSQSPIRRLPAFDLDKWRGDEFTTGRKCLPTAARLAAEKRLAENAARNAGIINNIAQRLKERREEQL